MVSLLLTVFILQVVIHLINTVGATTINELLWALYNKLPTPSSTAARNAALQKREVLRLKKEMNGISAQDDFARWAKIRRQHDKAVAEHDKSGTVCPYPLSCLQSHHQSDTRNLQHPPSKPPNPDSTTP
ncbi:GET complex subunit get1 [Cryomyces antarcticus]|uniref:GET complex subunit get1 n=1 Tax=Cryomyces antarcticus TaxID=329879 RepID=A0ABR0LSV8_9PEZI|nr:GET complex subunit get1 [Cryomyces antarcticus]